MNTIETSDGYIKMTPHTTDKSRLSSAAELTAKSRELVKSLLETAAKIVEALQQPYPEQEKTDDV